MMLLLEKRVNFVSDRLLLITLVLKKKVGTQEKRWYGRKKNKNVLFTYCFHAKLWCIGYLPGNLPGQQHILFLTVVFSLIFEETLHVDLKIT